MRSVRVRTVQDELSDHPSIRRPRLPLFLVSSFVFACIEQPTDEWAAALRRERREGMMGWDMVCLHRPSKDMMREGEGETD